MTHNKRFEFALSFSSVQRPIAKAIRDGLVKSGIKVYYDQDFEHEIIGKNGAEYLRNIYSRESKYCIVLISRDYDLGQWTALEKEAIEERELRGERGVLIPVRIDNHTPSWLPKTRNYFDLSNRNIDELLGILTRLVSTPDMVLVDILNQTDLYNALPGTTWRKINGLETLIFKPDGLFYNNYAGHPNWLENYYQISDDFRAITVIWKEDEFTTRCVFNEAFSEFYEIENKRDGVWVLISKEPHTPSWRM